MDFNFFNWIRMGVKDSVLLGVTDAVNTMGMPPDEDSSRKILSFLQEETQSTQRRRIASAAPSTTGQRKLGRSISDIHATKEV